MGNEKFFHIFTLLSGKDVRNLLSVFFSKDGKDDTNGERLR